MSSDDFSVHTKACEEVSGMSLSSLPDEVTSLDDLACECWEKFDSFEDIPSA
ncbi:hypothetical protein [Haloferax sp. DFSO60]|uniref:hypothetical protein n=1 Tax=Haloferax sp. DFSO60 TaxID=3388652 RepID=UPI00397CA7A4